MAPVAQSDVVEIEQQQLGQMKKLAAEPRGGDTEGESCAVTKPPLIELNAGGIVIRTQRGPPF